MFLHQNWFQIFSLLQNAIEELTFGKKSIEMIGQKVWEATMLVINLIANKQKEYSKEIALIIKELKKIQRVKYNN